jgi:hypothetical protein
MGIDMRGHQNPVWRGLGREAQTAGHRVYARYTQCGHALDNMSRDCAAAATLGKHPRGARVRSLAGDELWRCMFLARLRVVR